MIDLVKIDNCLTNEPGYRQKEVDKLLFQDFIADWSEAQFLPIKLKQLLFNQAPIEIKGEISESADKRTQKALLVLNDGLKVETVLMRFKNRNTVCVSSAVGCPLNCSFCATGQMGFKRNLLTSEIVAQVLFFARILKKEKQKITNVVFMGMGEPFLNYNNVLQTINFLHQPEKMNLGARRFSISTCGVPEGIRKLAKEPLEINLAISLHAPNEEIRTKLVPINRKYPLKEIMFEVNNYLQENKRKVMFEYILIDSINDSPDCARELAQLLGHNPLYHLNLIQYNPTGIFKPSRPENIAAFKTILHQLRIPFTQRYRFGEEIDAACGQLATRSSD